MAKMPKMISKALPPDDDLVAMERSTFETFIDESQAGVLLEAWARNEQHEDRAFREEFCTGEGDEDE